MSQNPFLPKKGAGRHGSGAPTQAHPQVVVQPIPVGPVRARRDAIARRFLGQLALLDEAAGHVLTGGLLGERAGSCIAGGTGVLGGGGGERVQRPRPPGWLEGWVGPRAASLFPGWVQAALHGRAPPLPLLRVAASMFRMCAAPAGSTSPSSKAGPGAGAACRLAVALVSAMRSKHRGSADDTSGEEGASDRRPRGVDGDGDGDGDGDEDRLGGVLLIAVAREQAARAVCGVQSDLESDLASLQKDLVGAGDSESKRAAGAGVMPMAVLPSSQCLHAQRLLDRAARLLAVPPSLQQRYE